MDGGEGGAMSMTEERWADEEAWWTMGAAEARVFLSRRRATPRNPGIKRCRSAGAIKPLLST